jgi:hypothetical protein
MAAGHAVAYHTRRTQPRHLVTLWPHNMVQACRQALTLLMLLSCVLGLHPVQHAQEAQARACGAQPGGGQAAAAGWAGGHGHIPGGGDTYQLREGGQPRPWAAAAQTLDTHQLCAACRLPVTCLASVLMQQCTFVLIHASRPSLCTQGTPCGSS